MALIDIFLERKPLIDIRPVRLALLRSARRVFVERRTDLVADIAGEAIGQAVKTPIVEMVKRAVRDIAPGR